MVLFMLMLLNALAFSQAPVELGGSNGMNLLNSLAKSSLDQINDSVNDIANNTVNDTVNNTVNDTVNATDNTKDLSGTNGIHSAKFLSWGKGPKSHTSSSNYNRSTANSGVVDSPPNPLAMTSDLRDLNDLAEKNAFATA